MNLKLSHTGLSIVSLSILHSVDRMDDNFLFSASSPPNSHASSVYTNACIEARVTPTDRPLQGIASHSIRLAKTAKSRVAINIRKQPETIPFRHFPIAYLIRR
jgi:hypothetical protein